ncbi:MAG: hypothetical protein ACTSRP_27670, partial [Candidatus Helarchaeota archaeon]
KNFKVSRILKIDSSINSFQILDIIEPKKRIKFPIKLEYNFHFSEKSSITIINSTILINNIFKIKLDKNNLQNLKINKTSYYYSKSYGFKERAPLVKIEFYHSFENKKSLKIPLIFTLI